MKPANEYLNGIYEMDADTLVKHLVTMLDDISNGWRPELSGKDAWAASVHDAIVSSVDVVAVYFSPVHGSPIDLPPPFLNRKAATREEIVQKIRDIVEVLRLAQIVTHVIGMKDFEEVHASDDEPVPARVAARSQQIFSRLQPVSSFLVAIAAVAEDWLKEYGTPVETVEEKEDWRRLDEHCIIDLKSGKVVKQLYNGNA